VAVITFSWEDRRMAHRFSGDETVVRARTIAVFALAFTACGGKISQRSGAEAGASNTGNGADNVGSGSAGSTVATGGTGSVGGSGSATSGTVVGPGSIASGTATTGTFLGSGPVSSGISTSGGVVGSGSGASGTSADVAAFCGVPDVDAGALPFVVDTVYQPTGWMGDAPAYPVTPTEPPGGFPANGVAPAPGTPAHISLLPVDYSSVGDACTADGVGRSSANAKGSCWKVTYTPFPRPLEPGSAPGMTQIGTGMGYGWAGVFWQYPVNNWGNLGGGYPIPPGATTISFWARGGDGGEKVRFLSGEGSDYGLAGATCADYVPTVWTNAVLSSPPAWQHVTIDITGLGYGTQDIAPGQGAGGYYGGVIGAFAFYVEPQTLPSLDGGSAPPNETDPDAGPVIDPYVPDASFPPFFDSTITFYIDDIEFQ
jgi:hypothetical protein